MKLEAEKQADSRWSSTAASLLPVTERRMKEGVFDVGKSGMGGYRHARWAVAVTTSVSPVAYRADDGAYERRQDQQTREGDQALLPPGHFHCTGGKKNTC